MTIEEIRRVRRQGDRLTVRVKNGPDRILTAEQFNAAGYRSRVTYGVNEGRYDMQAVTE